LMSCSGSLNDPMACSTSNGIDPNVMEGSADLLLFFCFFRATPDSIAGRARS